MSNPTIDMLPIALQGFHAARQRYCDGLGANHPEEQLVIPAVEVIYWACILDEQLEKRDNWYKACQEYGRCIMLGTRYARNRATHQLPMLLERRDGFQAPISAPFRAEEMVWLSAVQLPAPSRRPGKGQLENYEQYLAGKPVRHTLDRIADWFAAEQNRPGSLIGVSPWGDVAVG